MPDAKHRDWDIARRIIEIDPQRIPQFIIQSRAERSLARTISALNKQFSNGTQREMELAEEALRRLGFIAEADSATP